MTLILARQIVLGLGALAAGAILIVSADSFSILAIAFVLWAVAPLLLLALMNRTESEPRFIRILLLVIAVAITAVGTQIYIDAMFIHTDPQSAIVFFIIPLYQAALIGLIAVLIPFLKKWLGTDRR